MKRTLFATLAAATLAPLALAQDGAKAEYEAALECAGRFKWLLDASSGGQPPVNGYTLDQRVKAATALEAKVRALAPAAGVEAGSVAGAILNVSDDTTELFYSEPEKVEGRLAACKPMAGIG